jgi:hypothetical protein
MITLEVCGVWVACAQGTVQRSSTRSTAHCWQHARVHLSNTLTQSSHTPSLRLFLLCLVLLLKQWWCYEVVIFMAGEMPSVEDCLPVTSHHITLMCCIDSVFIHAAYVWGPS